MTKEKFMELLDEPGSVVDSGSKSYNKGSVYRSVILTIGDEHWMMTERSDDWDCEYCEDEPIRVEPVDVVTRKWRPVK